MLAAAAAPSKVPFYVVGGMLALWAVLLGLWGISHHEFPGSSRRAHLVMLGTFVLMLGTMATAVVTGGGEEEPAEGAAPAPAPAPTGRTLALAADPAGGLTFDKREAAVEAGRVTVRLTNDSAVPHNVTIAQGDRTLGATATVTDADDTTEVELQPGEYVFYCSVTGHREAGMEGTLTAE
jgi:plastocyanin